MRGFKRSGLSFAGIAPQEIAVNYESTSAAQAVSRGWLERRTEAVPFVELFGQTAEDLEHESSPQR